MTARPRTAGGDPFDRLWRLLSSVRFAMLLIALAAGGVLVGTVIMQAPAEVAAQPETFAGWLARPRGKYGEPWATIFAVLDLYRVFSSLWFRGVVALLALSVVVCTVNRLPRILAGTQRPMVNVPERLFERAPLRAGFQYAALGPSGPEQVHLQTSRVLKAQGYRVVPWQEGSVHAVFADKNRFGRMGTLLNHVGIVTILGAAVLGNVLGWREESFMVPEGSVRAVGHETGLVVRNESFVDEYYPSGTPRDYRSELVLLEHGQEVARKTIRVNDPLDYNGVRFHQAFFGPAAVMRVSDATGNVVFEDGVPLGYEFTGGGLSRNGGSFTLGNRRLAVFVIVPAARRGPDPDIPAGTVRLEFFEPRQLRPSAIETLPQGVTKQIMGYTFEFVRERQFSGLQVVHNPAVNIIWVAAACMLLGMLAVFNFPLRRVWARAEAGSTGTRLRLAAVSNRDVLFAREFEGLSLAIDREVEALAHRLPRTPPGGPKTASLPATQSETLVRTPLEVGQSK